VSQREGFPRGALAVGARRVSLAIVLAGLLVLFLWVLPAWLTQSPHVSGSDRQTAVNAARVGIASILAVLGTAVGVGYTIRTYRLSRQGQTADRYTKAIEQLSADNGAIRIGGIYALKQTTNDAPEYQQIVIDVLAAYIRANGPWPPIQDAPEKSTKNFTDRNVPEPDIQAALSVLRGLVKVAKRASLDLSHSNLRGADMMQMYLLDAKLQGSNLKGAKLNDADLRGADLRGADLDEAEFYQADLTDVRLLTGQVDLVKLYDVAKGVRSIRPE
jgi:Pentapeptide repeats (8 copies)